MKYFALLFVFVAVVFAERLNVDEEWEKFKNQYNKAYTSVREEAFRKGVFAHHLNVIQRHNHKYGLGLKSYRLGVNEYADLMNSEFRQMMNGYKPSQKRPAPHVLTADESEALPTSVNWADKGAVTEIKNQAQCGSCWAFSTTGSVEGQHYLATKKLVSLSEQNLVDCSGPEGNMGCEGGLMDQGFEYIIKNKGIDTEESYPYTAEDGTCHFKRADVGATISSYVDVDSQNENALQKAIANVGPISVAIDASQMSFQLYEDGVYDEPACSTTALDHGVLAVGYDNDSASGKDYYLVKNSWGTTWGISGYIKMSRNNGNQCGIATQASYPVV